METETQKETEDKPRDYFKDWLNGDFW